MLRKFGQNVLVAANHKKFSRISLCFASCVPNATETSSTSTIVEEVRIPVPWGHIAGKWWGPKNIQPIFTCHGWQDNCQSFDLLIAMLPKHLSFLALDSPGHGLSSKIPPGFFYHSMNEVILIRRLQAYFKFEKISLLGHSLGAVNNYTYGGLFPQSVDFMICLDGLSPLVNPKRLDRTIQTIDEFLKYDMQVESMYEGKSEPPNYTKETMIQVVHKGSLGSIDKDKCMYIIDRNIKESKLKPGLFYFNRDPRVKTGPLLNWPVEDLIEHAKRIDFPLMLTIAEQSPVRSSHQLIMQLWGMVQERNPAAELHRIKGKHHAHLNTPEIFAEIITQFIEKYDRKDKSIDLKIFEAIRHL